MTTPTTTPNPATESRPQRSSRRVSRKTPLGWLPWALLAALLLLALLCWLLAHFLDKDDNNSSGSNNSAVSTTQNSNGPGGLAALPGKALVGGGAVAAGKISSVPGAQALAQVQGEAGTVLFAEGSAAIDPAGQQVIANAVQSLKSAGAKTVMVTGYTDVIAGQPVNAGLSQQRADAVANALKQGLPGVNVTTAAKGEADPVASNDTDQGRQLNRRAVIAATG